MMSLSVNELVREYFPYHWVTNYDTELILSYVIHHIVHTATKELHNTKNVKQRIKLIRLRNSLTYATQNSTPLRKNLVEEIQLIKLSQLL